MLLSKRAYARHRKARGLSGHSHQSVTKAIEAGRLDESLVYDAAGTVHIHPEVADREWDENTDGQKQRAAAGGRPALEDTSGQGKLFEEPAGESHAGGPSPDEKRVQDALRESNAMLKAYQARRAELDYRQAAGELCEVSEVKKTVSRLFRQTRDSILSVPDRLSSILAGEERPKVVQEILRAELEKCLAALADAEDAGDS